MFLFHQIVFGPIHSRRLGSSLGINILPVYGKWCNFNCIYCECGWNENGYGDNRIPGTQEVAKALEEKLSALHLLNTPPDVITFSGNGEPTLHPDFKPMLEETLSLRNKYAPNAKVCVLSNATQLDRPSVFEALQLADKRILKIDSAFPETIERINQPVSYFNYSETLTELKRFHGDFTLQTLFVRGVYKGVPIDNATQAEVQAWLNIVMELRPKEVMIYTIDRKTPAKELVKVPLAELEGIGDCVKALGMNIQVHIAG